jgi:hypothetical protein
MDAILTLINDAIDPKRMTQREALEFLERLEEQIESMCESIRDDMMRDAE